MVFWILGLGCRFAAHALTRSASSQAVRRNPAQKQYGFNEDRIVNMFVVFTRFVVFVVPALPALVRHA